MIKIPFVLGPLHGRVNEYSDDAIVSQFFNVEADHYYHYELVTFYFSGERQRFYTLHEAEPNLLTLLAKAIKEKPDRTDNITFKK
jgi:hypothetical protein